jgi:putative copper resistance protein D
VELVLFGLAVGTAVALSRTAAPGLADDEDLATSLLGFGMPGPLTAGRVLGDWLPDPLFIAASLIAVSGYLVGVRRLHRRGDAWAGSRTVAFLAGNAVIVLATSSGLARYGPVLFSVHMVQHLLLAMVAPILLALAAPMTLGLRAFRASPDAAWPGPREVLQAVLRLPAAGMLARPLVALLIYVTGMYVMYLTGLFELALRSHAAHLAMVVHFLAAGYLFFWVMIGVDPAPRPRPVPPLRILLVLIAMALHAFLGIAIMQSSDLFAGDWFAALPRAWGPTPAVDQQLAGGIAWSFGEIPTVVVIGILVRQWIRADEREQRRIDRDLDRREVLSDRLTT